MPRLIPPTDAATLEPAECLAMADAARIDPREEAGLATLAPLLAGLAQNRDFLGQAALDALADGGGNDGGYGAQVLMLAPSSADYMLRANLWPAPQDADYRESGPRAFFYGVPHDHNFSFLTCGYAGPGYYSDDWEVDPDKITGLAGEQVALRPLGRHRLAPGEVRLYRAHRDVHRQAPPDAFSVSLNLMARGAETPWRDQYRFDTERDRIAEVMGATPAELLLDLAVRLANGLDLAERFARGHPRERMRVTAWQALARAAPERLPPILRRAGTSRYLAAHARRIESELERIATGQDEPAT